MLTKLSPHKYFLDYGPAQMLISAFAANKSMDKELQAAEEYLSFLLKQLSANLHLVKGFVAWPNLPGEAHSLHPVLLKMYGAVSKTGDKSLTPMAAVAGALADEIADFLVERGASMVIVNNGGDIALRLREGEELNIGLKPSLYQENCSYFIKLKESDRLKGIATSGLGGRGFTCGIASAATVLAEDACLADACATLVANHTYADDPGIISCYAEEIDPETDIRGTLVTIGLKNLKPEVFQKAIENGLKIARKLTQEKIMRGLILCAGPYMSVFPPELSARIISVSNKKVVARP